MADNLFQTHLEGCLDSIANRLNWFTRFDEDRSVYEIPAVLTVEYPGSFSAEVNYLSVTSGEVRQCLSPWFYVLHNYVVTDRREDKRRMAAAIARSILVDLSSTSYSSDLLLEAATDTWCTSGREIDTNDVETQLDLALSLGNTHRISSQPDAAPDRRVFIR